MRRLLVIAVLWLVVHVFPLRACDADIRANPVPLVQSWYQRYLHQAPRPCDLREVCGHLQAGWLPEQALAELLGGEEYYTCAGRTPEGFVCALYRDLFGREATPAELCGWARGVCAVGRCGVAFDILRHHPHLVRQVTPVVPVPGLGLPTAVTVTPPPVAVPAFAALRPRTANTVGVRR